MGLTKIYQTLEDKANPDTIEKDGPFSCNWDNTWLSTGYYFWDSFIENAHWWGSVRYGTDYVICEGQIIMTPNNCLDLVGNTNHMLEFEASLELMKEAGLITDDTTVATVIEFLKDNDILGHSAIRAYGINSRTARILPGNFRMYFEISSPPKKQFLDFKPAIQICIFDLRALNYHSHQIVYPDEYITDYMI